MSSSNYQAQNLSYDQPSHAQQYWNQQYPPANNPKPSQTPFDYPGSGPVNVQFDNHRVGLNRTPSPTPSEAKELSTGAIDFKSLMNWRFWIRRQWLWYYVAGLFIVILTTLITIFHDQIVTWLTPATQLLKRLKFGWLVPIGILFVLSFPPLFGHEIVAILCGLVWGLWIGFAIVAAGSFLGEVGNFYAFKYCCRARGAKMEKTKMYYACLAKVVREGGFKIALIARLSAIPGHFTTAIFSTCGMNIFVFSIAAILSSPKQFITVYLGVILGEASGQETTKQKLISDGVVAVTILVTIAACWYILRKMDQAKPRVIYDRRKARQAKMSENGNGNGVYSTPSFSSSDMYNPNSSESNIPLTAKKTQFGGQPYPFSSEYQSSSASGNGSIVYAPKPQHRYEPDNRYGLGGRAGSESESEEDLVGHAGASYNYAPTRQASDSSDEVALGAPPGVPVPPTFPRTQTQSPDAISKPIPQQSQPQFSSPYQHQTPYQPQPQSPSLSQTQNQIPYQHQMTTPSSPFPYTHSYQPQSQPPPQVVQVQTPTQAQFVSYNPAMSPSPVVSGAGMHSPIVGPGTPTQYASPQLQSQPYNQQSYQHSYEPTDATYHTAMASSDSLPPPGYI